MNFLKNDYQQQFENILMTDKNLEKLRQQIIDETDGVKFSKLIEKLKKKYASIDTSYVLDILTDYAKHGQILHWRNFLLPDIIKLVGDSETEYITFFEWCITQPELIYWGIDGLLKTQGKECFSALIELAKNESLNTPIRAKAIKSISIYSKQPFDRDLPKDPGYWKTEDLRIVEIEAWQKNGYQNGKGYAKPKTHPSLEDPKTELEKTVSKFNRKLEAKRNKNQDLSNPTNWLVIADQTDLLSIAERWNLPETYRLFLSNYSPLHVHIDSKKYFQGLHLYGASELLKRQEGYSFNPVTNQIIDEWPKNLVVIADAGADPYCIDLSQIKENDAPVYKSTHGTGVWEFELYTDSFLIFLKEIAGA
ncbi:SMI1/KNR4 family protein [Sphingobacterium tabacisoli]|uniref:SMI1/KNR4 family protein n=1 Tax=Sphingobacterium tabacisoli TaxID=2044855 RepID=A0ABW5L8N8_9SPHI|nr:SMI1/KNR4 family protein [Sphingobacterium tabacisoli]